MQPGGVLNFAPFSFDATSGNLSRGLTVIQLRPKTRGLLAMLLERAGEIIDKEAIFTRLWPDVAVTDVVLSVCVAELRRALGDRARNPCYVETVHGRGLRFIAPVTRLNSVPRAPARGVAAAGREEIFVGRLAELEWLWDAWGLARAGNRGVALITGDPGVGKSALMNRFLSELAVADGGNEDVIIARGRCLHLNAVSEAFMPVIEALADLCSGAGGPFVLEALRVHAPSWLPCLPKTAAISAATPSESPRSGGPETMVREASAALKAIARRRAVVLALEDLQWADPATIDFLTAVAHQCAGERFLVIGTLRAVESTGSHRLRSLLALSANPGSRVSVLSLPLLSGDAIAEYLRCRLRDEEMAEIVAPFLTERTEGHPLFMAAVTDHLLDMGSLQQQGGRLQLQSSLGDLSERIPPALSCLLDERIAEFTERQLEAAEAASINGGSFSAQVVAAALDSSVEEAEQVCHQLVEKRFVVVIDVAPWPDGSVGECYRFRHALYRQAVADRLTPARRRRLHLCIGKRLEQGFAVHTTEIASDLALHFDGAGDDARFSKYAALVGRKALDRALYVEAVNLFQTAYAALLRSPPGEERDREELRILSHLVPSLIITPDGGAAEDLARLVVRARHLARRLGWQSTHFATLAKLTVGCRVRGEMTTADVIAQEALVLAQEAADERLLLSAHHLIGGNLFHASDLVGARSHFATALQIADRRADVAGDPIFEQAAVAAGCQLAVVLCLTGQPDEARCTVERVLARHTVTNFLSVRATLDILAAWTFILLRDVDRVASLVDGQAPWVSSPFTLWTSVAQVMRGWAWVQTGCVEAGLNAVDTGFESYVESQGEWSTFDYQVLRADAYRLAGRLPEAARIVEEGLETLRRYGQGYFAAEMHLIRGHLFAAEGTASARRQAEACYGEGLRYACDMKATASELRLTLALAHVLRSGGEREAACRMLRPILALVESGGVTPDVVAARAFLDAD